MSVNRVRRSLRLTTLALTALLPAPAKRAIYCHVFGYKIAATATIRLCILDAGRVRIGEHARIGHFTVIRNLPELVLEDHATLGQWNWITCGEFFTNGMSELRPPAEQGLFLGAHAALTSRHYVDCAGGVFIGAFTTVAGVRSAILTHQIDFEGRQECKAVKIGDYCYIGSNARFVPGAAVGNRCVIGMGALVAGILPECDTLYVGVPARAIRKVGDGDYFHRTVGQAR